MKEINFDEWEDAYSFKRMGYVISSGCIKAMQKDGLTEKQIKKIFYSKEMRWFMDNYWNQFERLAEMLFFKKLLNDKFPKNRKRL